jgi:hypothetical protein
MGARPDGDLKDYLALMQKKIAVSSNPLSL